METVSEKILISGPSVSELEVEYASDAAKNGWNLHCFDYINKFERTAREYLSVKYALGLSSCTAALHLAVLSLGIGIGDEVIIPESTWVSTANAVSYVQATPVFVDVDKDTWTIDPEAVRRAITQKTKAIIVVNLYGHPCNMEEIMSIAKENNLYVIEDAAQSLGGEYFGKKTGTLADIGCFSFHGSKAVVMGEGGLLVTDNEEIYEKVKFIGDQCKHPTKRFFNTDIGYKYKLSNLQAAFGTAQLERADHIIAKKRQIYNWYKERLNDIPDIKLNTEQENCKNTYWMPTIVLGDSHSLNAYELSERLLDANIDSRPFFYPLSMLPMYSEFKRFNNPIAYKLCSRALNIPGGYQLTEEEVDYICFNIKTILLDRLNNQYTLKGWLKFKEDFKYNLVKLKSNDDYSDIEIKEINYTEKLCLISTDLQNLTKDKSLFIISSLGINCLYIKCLLSNKDTLSRLQDIGFTEVFREAVTGEFDKHSNAVFLRTSFYEAKDYVITLKYIV